MKIEKEKKALDKLYRRRDRYELQPDFQREEVWSLEKEQSLLDTILKNWDIPKVYVRVVNNDNFEIADGQQRLNAIFKFYDNKIPLSNKLSKEYPGQYYASLPDTIKDIFDDYELDITLIRDATDREIRDLFGRLQLGVPLNSAEKLNSMLGNMRDFVKELSETPFFQQTSLASRRYAYQSICAQLVKLEIDGAGDLKYKDLSNFYSKQSQFNINSLKAKKIKRILKYIQSIFSGRENIFRNKASIVSLYYLISKLVDKGIDLNKTNSKKLRDFYIDFQDKLSREVQKGSDATNTELIMYQSKVNQAADSKESIETRNKILEKKLAVYEKSFQNVLFKGSIEIVDIENTRKNEISALSTDLISLISDINKIRTSQNQQDMFKPTNEVLAKLKALNEPATIMSKYKSFIDGLYKIYYEGSGSLSRIPTKFVNKNSVFIDIKNLRTDAYHDIEHGKKKKIELKQTTIANTYEKYTGSKNIISSSNSNLFTLQKKIMENLKSTLILIIREIK